MICLMKYVYVLTDPRTGEIRYVGVTTLTPPKRLESHLGHVKRGDQSWRSNWIRSLSTLPDIKVVEHGEWSDDEMWDAERWWIKHLRSTGHRLTNATAGGEGVIATRTLQWRMRISESNRGRVISPEHRAKISAALMGRPRPDVAAALKGVPFSPERRARMRSPMLGKKHTAASRAKTSASLKGQPNHGLKTWRSRRYNIAVKRGWVLSVVEVNDAVV